jgi:hypothetical protein
VLDQLALQRFPLLRDHEGHPCLRGLVADACQVISL